MPSGLDQKDALRVLGLAVEFMEWKTFEGGKRERADAALRLQRDGMYHFADGKIDIAYDVNTRPHRTDTYIRISLIRGFLRKRELVFDAENNHIKAFRPGRWVDHVARLAEGAKADRRTAEETDQRLRGEAASRAEKEARKNFAPVDDSAIFKG